jgi:hypothetical protein
MKLLLIISAVIEAAVGLSLLAVPAFTAAMLLGAPIDTPAGLVAGRVAGAALLALGLACWRARDGASDGAAEPVVIAILFYNFAAVAVLVWASMRLGLFGPLLWPTIVMHLALGVWCVLAFTRRQVTLAPQASASR